MDPIIGGALIGAGSNLVGGLLGRSGQRSANERNLQIAREQMAFQERMSNTAYQRAAKDLEAAGLNRILALGKPASTPAGALATMQNEEAILSAAVQQITHSALDAAHKMQSIKTEKARTKLVGKQGDALSGIAALGNELGNFVKGSFGQAAPTESWADKLRGGLTDIFEFFDPAGITNTNQKTSAFKDAMAISEWEDAMSDVSQRLGEAQAALVGDRDNAELKKTIRDLKLEMKMLRQDDPRRRRK